MSSREYRKGYMGIIDDRLNGLLTKISLLKSLLEDSELPSSILKGIVNSLTEIEEETIEKQSLYNIAQKLPFKDWALKRILDSLPTLYARLFRLNAAYSFLKTYSYQQKDPDLHSFNTVMKQFTEELCDLCSLNMQQVLPMISYSYSCWPLSEIPFYPVFIPPCDSNFPNPWVILAHEYGHIYYDTRTDMISRKLLPEINDVVQRRISQIVSDTEAYTASREAAFIWVKSWTPEFFSDCFATRILGPAYVALSNLELLGDETEVFPPSHPPPTARINFCLTALQNLQLEGMAHYIEQLTEDFREVNRLPRIETDGSRKLEIFLDQDILEKCFRLIEENVDIFSIRQLWPDILKAKERLSVERRIDSHSQLVPQICAAILLKERFPIT